MAVHRFNGADIVMANEMFMASPDGQLEAERIQRLIDDLPDVQGTISGFPCSDEYAD